MAEEKRQAADAALMAATEALAQAEERYNQAQDDLRRQQARCQDRTCVYIELIRRPSIEHKKQIQDVLLTLSQLG